MRHFIVTIEARGVWTIPVEAEDEKEARLLAHCELNSGPYGAIEQIDNVVVEEQA